MPWTNSFPVALVLARFFGPSAATLADALFAYGCVAVLIGLIVWDQRAQVAHRTKE